jgi:NAD(P)H-hydrate epimerase
VTAFLSPPKGDGPQGGLGYPALVRDALVKAKAAGVEVREAGPEARLTEALADCDFVLDALLGTGSSGKPAGAIHHMIQEIEKSKKPVVSVDIPSGTHPDTGHHSGVFVTADLTLTLGLAKKGLLAAHAKRQVGELKVLAIGYPPALLK